MNHTRSSRDRTVNSNGRRLLEAFNNLGGIVLNGRADGDRQGSYSFCGVMGSSVIDYCVCSYSLLHYIKSFTIASKPYSDHMHLCHEFNFPVQSVSNRAEPELLKVKILKLL